MFTDWNFWKYHFLTQIAHLFAYLTYMLIIQHVFYHNQVFSADLRKMFKVYWGIFRARTALHTMTCFIRNRFHLQLSIMQNEGCKEDGNKDIINECILITSFLVRKLIEYSMSIYPGALKKHRKRIHHEERSRAQLLRRHSLPVQPLFEQPDSYNPRNQRYPNVGFMHKWNVLLRVN